jgi:pilus assembly protein CpaB
MKSGVIIVLALSCGLVAAIAVTHYVSGDAPVSVEATTAKIAVAKKEIGSSQPLGEGSWEFVDWPQDRVPKGAVSDPNELANLRARVRLYPGEPILSTKVLRPGENMETFKVPPGFRVVSVKVNVESSVSNLIQPGDRVDVVIVIRAAPSITKTILRDVRLFAVNSETMRAADSSTAPEELRTASLLVTPDQAEKLIMAAELGQLRLALRSPDDNSFGETSGCTYDQLVGRNGSDKSLAKADVATIAQPHWTMTVCSPQNASQFRWSAPDSTPECLDSKPSPASAARTEDAKQPNPPEQFSHEAGG